MPAEFEIFRRRAGGYSWRLVASNNQIIASGEHYAAKQTAVASVNAVKHLAPDAAVIDRTDGDDAAPAS